MSDPVPQADMNEPTPILREAQGKTVHDARMTGQPARPLASWAMTMGLGGLLLGYVGATDSYGLPITLRLGLWLGLCAVGGLIAITIELAAAGLGLRSRNGLVWWAVLTMGLAVAMVPVIFLVNSGGTASQMPNLGLFTLNSFAISAALVAFRLLVGSALARSLPLASNTDNSADIERQGTPRLLERLSPALQSAKLLALKSDGHYLRVYTDQGSEMILMRLKDAMGETAPVEGMQVHRSWWLARRSGMERRSTDGRIELKLNEDTWVPISRTHRSQWLKQNW